MRRHISALFGTAGCGRSSRPAARKEEKPCLTEVRGQTTHQGSASQPGPHLLNFTEYRGGFSPGPLVCAALALSSAAAAPQARSALHGRRVLPPGIPPTLPAPPVPALGPTTELGSDWPSAAWGGAWGRPGRPGLGGKGGGGADLAHLQGWVPRAPAETSTEAPGRASRMSDGQAALAVRRSCSCCSFRAGLRSPDRSGNCVARPRAGRYRDLERRWSAEICPDLPMCAGVLSPLRGQVSGKRGSGRRFLLPSCVLEEHGWAEEAQGFSCGGPGVHRVRHLGS